MADFTSGEDFTDLSVPKFYLKPIVPNGSGYKEVYQPQLLQYVGNEFIEGKDPIYIEWYIRPKRQFSQSQQALGRHDSNRSKEQNIHDDLVYTLVKRHGWQLRDFNILKDRASSFMAKDEPESEGIDEISQNPFQNIKAPNKSRFSSDEYGKKETLYRCKSEVAQQDEFRRVSETRLTETHSIFDDFFQKPQQKYSEPTFKTIIDVHPNEVVGKTNDKTASYNISTENKARFDESQRLKLLAKHTHRILKERITERSFYKSQTNQQRSASFAGIDIKGGSRKQNESGTLSVQNVSKDTSEFNKRMEVPRRKSLNISTAIRSEDNYPNSLRVIEKPLNTTQMVHEIAKKVQHYEVNSLSEDSQIQLRQENLNCLSGKELYQKTKSLSIGLLNDKDIYERNSSLSNDNSYTSHDKCSLTSKFTETFEQSREQLLKNYQYISKPKLRTLLTDKLSLRLQNNIENLKGPAKYIKMPLFREKNGSTKIQDQLDAQEESSLYRQKVSYQVQSQILQNEDFHYANKQVQEIMRVLTSKNEATLKSQTFENNVSDASGPGSIKITIGAFKSKKNYEMVDNNEVMQDMGIDYDKSNSDASKNSVLNKISNNQDIVSPIPADLLPDTTNASQDNEPYMPELHGGNHNYSSSLSFTIQNQDIKESISQDQSPISFEENKSDIEIENNVPKKSELSLSTTFVKAETSDLSSKSLLVQSTVEGSKQKEMDSEYQNMRLELWALHSYLLPEIQKQQKLTGLNGYNDSYKNLDTQEHLKQIPHYSSSRESLRPTVRSKHVSESHLSDPNIRRSILLKQQEVLSKTNLTPPKRNSFRRYYQIFKRRGIKNYSSDKNTSLSRSEPTQLKYPINHHVGQFKDVVNGKVYKARYYRKPRIDITGDPRANEGDSFSQIRSLESLWHDQKIRKIKEKLNQLKSSNTTLKTNDFEDEM